jgi:hypothetical protein
MFNRIFRSLMASALFFSLLLSPVLTASAQSVPVAQPTTDTAQGTVFLPVVTETGAAESVDLAQPDTLYASYQIVAVHSGKCLDIPSGRPEDQVPIQQYTCNTSRPLNQQWSPLINSLGPGTGPNISPFTILYSWNSRKCMDVAGASVADGTTVQQYICSGGANQHWYRIPYGPSGNFLIVSKSSGKCLDIAGGSLANGARVQQYRCNGGTNQQFRFQ